MTRKPVKSSQLAAIGYDPISQTLEVEFHATKKQEAADQPGSVYKYYSVPPGLHVQLMEADSMGSFFIAQIKRKPETFPFTKIQ